MPKQKNRKIKGRVNNDIASDNESVNDMVSIYSGGSCEADNFDEQQLPTSTEKYEEKMLQLIENCAEKSAKIRIPSLKSMCEIMQHRFFPDFMIDRKLTILDIIEKSLRRGKIEEQELAARLLLLLIIQIGGEQDDFKTVRQILSTILNNSVCVQSLAMFHFLMSDDLAEIEDVMIQFEQIFAKGESSSLANEDLVHLHVEALKGWSLLATLLPPGNFCTYINNGSIFRSINNLIGLLNSSHVEIRMTSGEIIALILERGRMSDESFLEEVVPNLIELTSILSKDSQKHRAKKERKAQRASFRDVLRYLEEDIPPDLQVRFGNETLLINTWSLSIQYEMLCEIIGPGITSHLIENDFVRDIFQLKMMQLNNTSLNLKQSKLERHLMNAAASKARTLTMKKSRDKRSVVFN